MFDLIKKVMSDEPNKDNGSSIYRDDAHIALCVLLLEAAHADGECTKEEMDRVVSTLKSQAGVAREDVHTLIDAAYQKRDNSVDLFKFTRYLNQHYSKEQKLEVMESVWRVIHADGQLESHEDQFAHKLANLLRLTHKELIDAKIKARQPSERKSLL
jgi:uncharacterized tellurite resistance protein B-like protein